MLTDILHRHLVELLADSDDFVIAVGRGEAAWDDAHPSPSPAATELVDERARTPVDDVIFLDDDGEPAREPSSRLQLSATFDGGSLDGPLREVGVFGGATSDPGTGRLLVYRTHLRLDVTAALRVTRMMRIDLGRRQLPPPEGRYLANTRSEELHDLGNLTENCQIDEIRFDRRYRFANVGEALALGYDRCAYCFGRELSER